MKFYIRLIIIMIPLILVLVFLRLGYMRTSRKEATVTNILRIPLFYRIIPIAVFVFCFLISMYILIFQFEDWPYILLIMIAFGLPFIIMFLTWSLWKVEMQDDGFVYRNYFGKKAAYKYSELKFEQHPKGLKWFFYKDDKKVLCIAYFIKNGDVLYKRYKRAIKKSA